MNPTQIFGTHLRDMMSYVGWSKNQEGYNHLYNSNEIISSIDAIDKAHTFLSQSMNVNKVIEILKDWDYHSNHLIHRTSKRTSMISDKKIKGMNWNDFALHCKNLGIELELNK